MVVQMEYRQKIGGDGKPLVDSFGRPVMDYRVFGNDSEAYRRGMSRIAGVFGPPDVEAKPVFFDILHGLTVERFGEVVAWVLQNHAMKAFPLPVVFKRAIDATAPRAAFPEAALAEVPESERPAPEDYTALRTKLQRLAESLSLPKSCDDSMAAARRGRELKRRNGLVWSHGRGEVLPLEEAKKYGAYTNY